MVISGYKEITKESRFLDFLLNIQKGMLLFIPLPQVSPDILADRSNMPYENHYIHN